MASASGSVEGGREQQLTCLQLFLHLRVLGAQKLLSVYLPGSRAARYLPRANRRWKGVFCEGAGLCPKQRHC